MINYVEPSQEQKDRISMVAMHLAEARKIMDAIADNYHTHGCKFNLDQAFQWANQAILLDVKEEETIEKNVKQNGKKKK